MKNCIMQSGMGVKGSKINVVIVDAMNIFH